MLYYYHFYMRIISSTIHENCIDPMKKKLMLISLFRTISRTIVRDDFRAAVTRVKFDRPRIHVQMMPGSFVVSDGTADAEMGRGISCHVIGSNAVARA